MMEILFARPNALPRVMMDIGVVIDVLRMTSTAAAFLRRPECSNIEVAATLRDLPKVSTHRRVIVSELTEAERYGQRIDNSPRIASTMQLANKTPALVTTNGTRALVAAAKVSRRVLLSSFNDVLAVSTHIVSTTSKRVALIPAGNFATGEPRIEDDLCADALGALLEGRVFPFEQAFAKIHRDSRVRERRISEPGFKEDLDLALRVYENSRVLEFEPVGDAVGRIHSVSEATPKRNLE